MRTTEGFAVWLTGLPASGKSTVARALSRRLGEMGIRAQIIESDQLRRVLTPRPKYTDEERDIFYGAMVYIGALLTRNGVNVIFDATAHRRRYRERARREMGRFIEVYVKCPLDVCESRDTKGLYRMARAGKITTLPGFPGQAPYEEPVDPDVVVNTDRETVEECVDKIMRRIEVFL